MICKAKCFSMLVQVAACLRSRRGGLEQRFIRLTMILNRLFAFETQTTLLSKDIPDFYRRPGFTLVNLKTSGDGHGCNEFMFIKGCV